jgi:hypothetical protein
VQKEVKKIMYQTNSTTMELLLASHTCTPTILLSNKNIIMRTDKKIMEGLAVYYTPENHIYLVQDNYGKTLSLIRRTLKYAKDELKLEFDEEDVEVQVLSGERYKHVMSLEFYSKTKPSRGTELTKDSGLWAWLKY